MRIDTVLTACNLKELYLDFIPIFIKAWRRIMPEVSIKIILIAERIPIEFRPHAEHITLFPPLPGISTGFISQYIRLLWPATLEGCTLTTDIDMAPMNRSYYLDPIGPFDEDRFVCYRDVLISMEQLPICYNLAPRKVWSSVTGVRCVEDIREGLSGVWERITYADRHGGEGWDTDQRDLYNLVMNWTKGTDRLVLLNDDSTGFSRLDRIHGVDIDDPALRVKIKAGGFSDYHMLRPYRRFKATNDAVVNLLDEKGDGGIKT